MAFMANMTTAARWLDFIMTGYLMAKWHRWQDSWMAMWLYDGEIAVLILTRSMLLGE